MQGHAYLDAEDRRVEGCHDGIIRGVREWWTDVAVERGPRGQGRASAGPPSGPERAEPANLRCAVLVPASDGARRGSQRRARQAPPCYLAARSLLRRDRWVRRWTVAGTDRPGASLASPRLAASGPGRVDAAGDVRPVIAIEEGCINLQRLSRELLSRARLAGECHGRTCSNLSA